jgi:hypothetical protein
VGEIEMNKDIKELVDSLFLLIQFGDFSNGITGEGGCPDEGRVRAAEMVERLEKQWSKLRTIKTEKQIVSGYHRPVCAKCHCELRPETNGVGVLDMADWGSYELWDADLWKCPTCGIEIVGGFAFGPVSAHYEVGFQEMIGSYKSKKLLIENKG